MSKKRKRGSGTLRKRADGRWEARVVIGYDEKGYYFNDPTAGERAFFTKEQVQIAYEAQGKQAVVIERV